MLFGHLGILFCNRDDTKRLVALFAFEVLHVINTATAFFPSEFLQEHPFFCSVAAAHLLSWTRCCSSRSYAAQYVRAYPTRASSRYEALAHATTPLYGLRRSIASGTIPSGHGKAYFVGLEYDACRACGGGVRAFGPDP